MVLLSLYNSSRDRATWDLSIIYAITFGAFVAFGVYLPVKRSPYEDLSDAAARQLALFYLLHWQTVGRLVKRQGKMLLE